MWAWFLASVAVALPGVPDVDAPLRTGASAPNDAAVVIGLEDYAFLADVPHARRDARSVYTWLVYGRGVPAERVALLTEGSREQILAAVGRARAQLGPGGTLFVSFAGHGATSPDDGGPLLVGDDARPDPTAFLARSLPVSALGTDAVLLLDTCWAGRGRDGAELVPGVRFAVPAWTVEATSGALLTAAQPSQLSEPYPQAEHGLFTYFLVGALRGWADGEIDGRPDGEVTLRETHAFVGRAIATVDPSGQQPTFSGTDRVLVRGASLEPPPDLAALPKPGSPTVVQAPVFTAVSGPVGSVPGVPSYPASSLHPPVIRTWTGPLEHVSGPILRTTDGREIGLSEAATATLSDPAVQTAWGGYRGAVVQQYTGGTLLGSAALLAFTWGLQVGLGDGSTDLGTTTAIYGLGALGTGGVGGAMVAVGTGRRAKQRAALVEAINATP